MWDWTCDKLAMKSHVSELAPDALIPEVLWQGEKLDAEQLAGIDGRWIFKGNSGSGQIVVGSGTPNLDELRAAIDGWQIGRQADLLGESAYAHARELLFFEQWVGRGPTPPIDYKVFVFDGVARFITAHSDRFDDHRASIYTADWQRIDARLAHAPVHETDLPRPAHFEALVEIAQRIGKAFDFIRVDLFDTDDGVWFGETSPYPWSGLGLLIPHAFELEAGSFWTLPDLSHTEHARR